VKVGIFDALHPDIVPTNGIYAIVNQLGVEVEVAL